MAHVRMRTILHRRSLITAVREAHLLGKKLYLTVNTLLKDSEMDGLYDYLLPYY